MPKPICRRNSSRPEPVISPYTHIYPRMESKKKKGRHLCQLVVVFALLWMPLLQAQAQDEDDDDVQEINTAHDRVLKVNPLQLGEVSLSFEKMRAERVSNEIALSYIYRSYLNGDEWLPVDVPVQGVGVKMSQRRYSKKNMGRPFGFFHGFVFGYRLLVFEEDVFGLPEQDPNSTDYRFVGSLYQNSLDLSYQLGVQFKLSSHLTAEAAGALGGRAKYALAKNAGELLTDHIIGHAVVAEDNSAVFVVPMPQLNFSLGYSF